MKHLVAIARVKFSGWGCIWVLAKRERPTCVYVSYSVSSGLTQMLPKYLLCICVCMSVLLCVWLCLTKQCSTQFHYFIGNQNLEEPCRNKLTYTVYVKENLFFLSVCVCETHKERLFFSDSYCSGWEEQPRSSMLHAGLCVRSSTWQCHCHFIYSDVLILSENL